ncbi:LapA family protein [Xylophilus rhododendri]|uniref:LapA family protein n=1 Tax=Xylophilus rhododendri TaxID=2697032 RepID=A0A857JAE1_9BURK|nr:LapA family protein [Xylophilus rhododendri]QHJ00698.1 LapA family protein [Xylophilus rhododendri]
MARTISLLVIALVIALLAALNWTTLATPTLVSLGVTSVTAPLGLLMLGLTVVLAIFFVAYVLALQGSVLMENRRHNREMQTQRDLADKAEASRLAEMRAFLDAQLQQQALDARVARDGLLARIDRLEKAVELRLEQSDNSTAAYLGQIEDRLGRTGPL